MIHKIGMSIQDLVTNGGSVLNGLSLTCGSCNGVSLIRAPRGSFTRSSDLPDKLFCPYCGVEGGPLLSGSIHDTRPVWGED